MKICIVGLGYVGLPLAIQFARSGAEVIGLDVDRAKVNQVNRGRSYIKAPCSEDDQRALKGKTRPTASAGLSRIKKADVDFHLAFSPEREAITQSKASV